MKNLNLIFLFISLTILKLTAQNTDLKLWYTKPASNWNEALPLGNGRLGAMVFGIPAVERIQINEETIWAGSPNSNANPKALEAIPEVRRLIWEGKYKEAEDMATERIMSRTNHGMPYQPMGDLYISFPGHNNYTNYYRDLNISNAFASVQYNVDGTIYQREIFSSFTDQAIIIKLSANKPGSITCNINVTTPLEKPSTLIEDNSIILEATATSHEKQSGKVRFQTRIKTKTTGGAQALADGIISIQNADEVIIYVTIATNFVNYKDISGIYNAKCKNYMDKAYSNDYQTAKSNHISYYKNYFNRVGIDLGTTNSVNNPTDKRIEDFTINFDPQLAATYFQFGRYLLISSSQPGTQPANLQGIWNDRLIPSWDSKYTTNINAEMNYWPAEPTNLSELHEPFLQMIKDVSETGTYTANVMYGARGWVLHHNTDVWRITGPVDRAASGMWPTGGAWFTQHLWYRYLYTGDKKFLESAYPILKGAAQFFMDFMVEEPNHKWLVVCPSNSPENAHAGSNRKATIAAGVTMDNQLIFDLFSNVVKATEILSLDKPFADSLKSAISKLAPMQIGQHGQLQEWMHDWDDPKDKHRHVSHLYGLYPSNQISPFRTPELFDAARTSLQFRGDPSTGWSMGWKVCFWARLLDGNHAYKLLTDQLTLVKPNPIKETGGTYPNMFDAHPPFQIDGNFGCTAGIAEMFLQSHDGFVFILPALPDVWKTGNIKGLVSRGGFVFDIYWENGNLKKMVVQSRLGGNLRLRVKNPLQPAKNLTLKQAKGNNPNPLFETPEIKKPLVSEKAKLNPVILPQTWVYDILTESGKTYEFYGK